MKLLRQLIREILLERSQAYEDMLEWWYNREEGDEAENYDDWHDEDLTKHRDMLSTNQVGKPGHRYEPKSEEQMDVLFADKKELKTYWNKKCDRNFWEGDKMQYFHSLSYYGGKTKEEELQQDIVKDRHLGDLSFEGFLKKYDLKDNKDEMSTYGIYNNRLANAETTSMFEVGVLISGRVTFAHTGDAWVESRSKATAKDRERHQGSGMPKRMTPRANLIDGVLFDEKDVKEVGVGECIVDNWDVEAICVSKVLVDKRDQQQYEAIANKYGVGFILHNFSI